MNQEPNDPTKKKNREYDQLEAYSFNDYSVPGDSDSDGTPAPSTKIVVRIKTGKKPAYDSIPEAPKPEEETKKSQKTDKADITRPVISDKKVFCSPEKSEELEEPEKPEEPGKPDEPERSEELEEEFLAPEDMWARQTGYGSKNIQKVDIEEVYMGESEEDLSEKEFLTPDEMIKRSSGKLLEKQKEKPVMEPQPVTFEDSATDDDGPPSEFLTPEEMIGRSSVKMQKKPETRPESDLKPGLAGDSSDESENREKPLGELVKSRDLSPDEMGEDYKESEGPEIIQLDTGPILKKKDIYSPDEILNYEEEEEEFESKAFLKGTIIKERFEISRIISEKRFGNTYIVRDKKLTNKKLILKEILPKPMSKTEYMSRRIIFQDAIRLITTFKHPNLIEIYEGFSENNRDYYTMELVEGLTIERLSNMNTKAFSEKEIIKWGSQLCDVTEFLHFRPVPFTLGKLKPEHILVDSSGMVRISSYDMQRFFDLDRTLAFRPDDPTKLYGDVTKIARILFFLLTKTRYNDFGLKLAWPGDVTVKMKKLLDISCKKGQKTYGDIRVFKNRLIDTQLEDTEESLKRKWGLSFSKIDFSWLKRAGQAIIQQKPAMLVLEIIAILFLVFFIMAEKKAKSTDFHRPAGPIVWLFSMDEISLFNADTLEFIGKKGMDFRVSTAYPMSLLIKPDPKSKKEERNVILLSSEKHSVINIIDSENLKLLGVIDIDGKSAKIVYDKESQKLFSLNRESGSVTVINLEIGRSVNSFLAGIDSIDMLILPLTSEQKTKKQNLLKLKKENPKVYENRKSSMPAPQIIVSNSRSRDIMFISSTSGKIIKSIVLKSSPGRMALSSHWQKLYIINKEDKVIMTYNIKKAEMENEIKLSGEDPSHILLDEKRNMLWVTMKGSSSITVVDLDKNKNYEIKAVGKEPGKMILDIDSENIWVLNSGTKDITAVDSVSRRIIKRISVGKEPSAICIEGHKFCARGKEQILAGNPLFPPSFFNRIGCNWFFLYKNILLNQGGY